MAILEVLFEVPKWIERGLATGALQRVGGVIVESGSKQVVAWLRDGGGIEQTVSTVLNIAAKANPLGIIFEAAKTAFSLYDNHLTREAIHAVEQSVQTLSVLTGLTLTGQVLNLALTAATFHATIRRLDKLSAEIALLGELIVAEFNRDRDMAFRMALQAARDVFESQQTTMRVEAVRTAIDGLYLARENFFIDFDEALKKELTPERLTLVQHYLLRAMYAETSRIRCYVASGETELAKQRLVEDMPKFRQRTELLIKHWIGKTPVAYFHKDIPVWTLGRFMAVQLWLKNENTRDARAMFNLVNELRSDFWNDEIIKTDTSVFEQVGALAHRIRGLQQEKEDRPTQMAKNLRQAEILIENYDRLLGFEIEVRSMRLAFDDWSRLVSEKDLLEHGAALIIDRELINEKRRLSRSQ